MNDTNRHAGGRSPARWPWLSRDLGLGRNNGILFWVHLVWGAGFTIQAALWTIFIESLGASPTQIGIVVGGGAVIRTLLVIPAGILADRFPLKPVIIAMLAVPILGALGLALATEWWHALAGAVLMDLSGVAIPAVSAYVAAASKPEDRTRTMTYIFSLSYLLSMAFVPAIGGWLAATSGFRTVYIVGAVLFACGIVIATRIDDIRPVHGSDTGESNDGRVGYRHLLASPGVRVVLAFHLLVPLLVFTGFTLLPNFMNDERGVSVATIGLLASAGTIVAFGVSLLVALAFMLRMCFSPIWSLMASAVADVTPERVRGRAYGLCEFGVGIGDTSAPIMAGGLYSADHRLPLGVGLLLTAPLALAALVTHKLRHRFTLVEQRDQVSEVEPALPAGTQAVE